MQLKDAAAMILSESRPHADLMRQASLVYDGFAAGREVPYGHILTMLDQAAGKGVLRHLHDRDHASCVDMITTLAREADRQAPVRTGRPARAS